MSSSLVPKPLYDYIKIFDYLYYRYLRLYNSTRIEPRYLPCVFWIYNTSQRILMLELISQKVYVSIYVTFNEQEFPFRKLSSNTNPTTLMPSTLMLVQLPSFNQLYITIYNNNDTIIIYEQALSSVSLLATLPKLSHPYQTIHLKLCHHLSYHPTFQETLLNQPPHPRLVYLYIQIHHPLSYLYSINV